MDKKTNNKVLKYVPYFIFLIIGLLAWINAYFYYQNNKSDIWLQVEEVVGIITFPFKLAILYKETPVTNIPVPVYAVDLADIEDTWGAARSMGRSHEGVDIFAKRGTPVYAATNGYVIRTGQNGLGGTVVFTVGPGGIRYYYAHLDRIAKGIDFGDAVTTDTIIGFVGSTGNASGTPPHLHFGIYKNGADNPYPLLVDR
jgi:murein DD-endopeptidase MepM/ murein hydrolase activator NlpD